MPLNNSGAESIPPNAGTHDINQTRATKLKRLVQFCLRVADLLGICKSILSKPSCTLGLIVLMNQRQPNTLDMLSSSRVFPVELRIVWRASSSFIRAASMGSYLVFGIQPKWLRHVRKNQPLVNSTAINCCNVCRSPAELRPSLPFSEDTISVTSLVEATRSGNLIVAEPSRVQKVLDTLFAPLTPLSIAA